MFSATTANTTFTTSIVALKATKTTSKRSATFVVRFNIILFAFLFRVTAQQIPETSSFHSLV